MDAKIHIHYDDLEDIAHKVARLLDRVDVLLVKARLCMTMMDDGAWIGPGADKYRTEMEDLTMPGLRRLRAALSDTHYGIVRAGDMLRDAEQYAAHQIDKLPEIILPSEPRTRLDDASDVPLTGGGASRPLFETMRSRGISGVFGAPDPRIPDVFPVGSSGQTVPRPDWYTEYSDDIDGFNGAVNGAVLLIDGGGGTSPEDHMGNLVGESDAAGGAPVSGLLVSNSIVEPRQAERAASAVGGFLARNPNAQLKLSPGLQALINGIATDSQGRSLMTLPTQAQVDAMRRFIEILRTTAEAFGRVIPGL